MTAHQFGGQWTEDKLNRIKAYLSEYMKIFKTNVRAKRLNPIYVDAFAGTGYRNAEKDLKNLPLFDDADAIGLKKGSAQIALETVPPFDEYIFIEKSPEYAVELEKLRIEFAQYADRITIAQEDANSYLQQWCTYMDWGFNRAVVFLDPYGMEVDWHTIEIIAQTQAIDLWILFPLGQAVNRLLTKNKPPEGALADRLTNFFGTGDWKDSFYQKNQQLSIFDFEEQPLIKKATFDSIGKYFIDRLKTVFFQVADKPLPLFNSRNVPIFLLCFAASNPKGAPTAVRIAQHILKK